MGSENDIVVLTHCFLAHFSIGLYNWFYSETDSTYTAIMVNASTTTSNLTLPIIF
jgi:hypothetical protein